MLISFSPNRIPIFIVAIVCCLFFSSAKAQDIQFSQFYAVPLYQNPAFTGSAFMHRITFHQRFQWMRLDARYSTSYVSWDTHVKRLGGGIGISAYHDYQGGDKIVSDEISAMYATEINLSPTFALRAGAQLTLGWRTIDYTRFQYPQDFTDFGYQTNTYDQYGNERFWYPDISTGALLYANHLWVGVSAHHMNEPQQTFYNNTTNRLPMKLALTGGYKFILDSKSSKIDFFQRVIEHTLIPTVHYKMQGKSDQLDLGLYSQMDRIIVGLWYRGIPVKQYDAIQNNESTVALAGFKYHNVVFTYSYDFTVSRLSRARTGGSHEINLTIYFEKKKSKVRHMKRLPCPDYFD